MNSTDFSHSDIVEEKEQRRREVVSNLPYIVALYSENCGKIHGYEVMQRVLERFNVLTGPSDVYHVLQELEDKKILESRPVICNGRCRKEYYPVEPYTSDYLKRFFAIKDEFDLEINNMRRKIENNSIQMGMLLPETAQVRSNRWGSAVRTGRWRMRIAND